MENIRSCIFDNISLFSSIFKISQKLQIFLHDQFGAEKNTNHSFFSNFSHHKHKETQIIIKQLAAVSRISSHI